MYLESTDLSQQLQWKQILILFRYYCYVNMCPTVELAYLCVRCKISDPFLNDECRLSYVELSPLTQEQNVAVVLAVRSSATL